MKLSYVLSAQDTKFNPIGKGSLREMLSILGDLGFDGVEIGIRDPAVVDIFLIEKLLHRYNLHLAAIGTGQAYVDDGLSLSDDREVIRSYALKTLKKHVEIAGFFSSYVVVGLIIGNVGLEPTKRDRKYLFIKNALDDLLEFAYQKGISILIEPLNRYERDIFNRAAEVVMLMDEISCPAFGLLLDTFHMNIEEVDILETIRTSADSVKHIHLADSNRLSPGKGHLNFREIIATLKDINYKGYLSFEQAPSPSMEEAAAYSIDYIKKLL